MLRNFRNFFKYFLPIPKPIFNKIYLKIITKRGHFIFGELIFNFQSVIIY